MNIYLIGICGITMGSIAIELKRFGHNVSGSDKGIYPPMSNMLKSAGIEIKIGYKKEHIDEMTVNPDIVIVANSIAIDNPEYLACQTHKLSMHPFPEVLGEYCVKPNSIVITGTFGKTTITALLVHIFKSLKIEPSYMIGGKALNLDNMVSFEKSNWSIVEGDEYFTSKTIAKSKFFYYKPKYLILTSAEWDHTDVFKTEEEYKKNFVELLKTIPEDGIIIANKNGKNIEEVIKEAGKENITTYYSYENTSLVRFKPVIIGRHNHENILAAITLVKKLKEKNILMNELSDDDFEKALINAINTYKGIYRRLNILYDTNKGVIVDDFAHNPSKFKATIEAIKEKYVGYDITAVIEPNMGNRTKLSLNSYGDTFKDAKKVIFPKWRVNKLKVDSELASGEDFLKKLKESNVNVELVMNDSVLLTKLQDIIDSKDKQVILFMGSEPLRGVPEELVKQIKNKYG